MNKPGSLQILMGAFLLILSVAVVGPSASADGGPLSIGARAVDYVPADGSRVWMGGVQARLRLPLFFAVDGSVDYRRDSEGASTVHEWPVQVSALMYVLPKIVWVQPFILAGGGWYHTTTDGPNGFSDTQTRFGPHVGAGVEFNLSSSWFLDATYRYVWLKDIHTVDAQGVSQDIKDSGHMITLGLNYRL